MLVTVGVVRSVTSSHSGLFFRFCLFSKIDFRFDSFVVTVTNEPSWFRIPSLVWFWLNRIETC